MNRRDLLLQQMGISQWQLRRHEVLKGAVTVPVANHIRLIIIAEQCVALAEPFFADVLRSVEVSSSDCLAINFEQAQHLNIQHSVYYWLLSENNEKIDRTLAQLQIDPSQLWRAESYASLANQAPLKRALWRQIQQSFSQSV
ncbi:DNA polymerase III psi subunit [Pasteurella langaaensis DSM 22999]|uniref:DNA polymerase III subunit psi n=1 Tax=Alitibacter langaaensis DSM 22999 TaxID=1122935 RepID=A0A2U0TH28_9PAST|nr:DNA polymerase III subunit psi [Pasteurella langaaensis]PVX42926.1 DNA polymerase III psi subunit [Pasteurella langaaensis DSM 22999]